MTLEISLLFIGGVPGGMELAVILLIAILLFGANKIPKLARSTGEAMGEFKKGREQVEQELQEMQQGQGTTTSQDNTIHQNDDSDEIVDEIVEETTSEEESSSTNTS